MTVPSEPAAHKLGPWTATALVVGNIIGIGAFVVPVSLAPYGYGSLLGWGVTLTGALCLAWVFAALARHMPDAGGAMRIVRIAFGGDAAFLNAWGYWVSVWVANAIIVVGAVGYLARLIPPLEQSRPLSAAVGVGLLWTFAVINLRGVQTAGRVQLITSILKMWPFIAAFAVAAMLLLGGSVTGGAVAVQPLVPEHFTLGVAATTTTLTLYSMLGLESAAVPSDVVADAARVVPRATVVGTALSGVLIMLLCVALVMFLPADRMAQSRAPLSDFVALGLGRWAALTVSVAVVISALGCLNGWVLIAGETPAAMAAAGDLPAWWGVRNARGASWHAALVSNLLTTVLIVLNGFDAAQGVFTFILQLATATVLLIYLLAPAAALRFMADGRLPRSRGLRIASVGALLFGAIAVIGSGMAAIGWGTVLVLAGWPLYRLMQRRVAVGAR